jgi:hypothetical protein
MSEALDTIDDTAFTKMGYRLMKRGEKKVVWGKPIGYMLLTIEHLVGDNTALVTSWFHNYSDPTKHHVMNHHEVDLLDPRLTELISYAEYVCIEGCGRGSNKSNFAFLTLEDQLKDIL